jgi:hypothetical protein
MAAFFNKYKQAQQEACIFMPLSGRNVQAFPVCTLYTPQKEKKRAHCHKFAEYAFYELSCIQMRDKPIMPTLHKQLKCLNCGHEFAAPNDNFCPQCGQQNNHVKLSTAELLYEWIVSAINLDSRFGHSIIPFLFRPGYLPKAFMEGKRMHYVHPVRFYIFVSFVFFFTFFQIIGDKGLDFGESERNMFTRTEIDSTLRQTGKFVKQSVLAGDLEVKDAHAIMAGLDSLSVEKIYLYEQKRLKDEHRETGNINTGFNMYRFNWATLTDVWLRDSNMTPDLLLDSMQVQNRTWFDYRVAEQALKYGKTNDPKTALKEIYDNIPVMMFFLMPIFAFLLKILYMRSKKLYIEHLVFTLHIHSYLFFMLTIILITAYFWGEEMALDVLVITLIVYMFLMFKNFYAQGWFKTFIKTSILFWSYLTLLILALVIEVLVSFLTF